MRVNAWNDCQPLRKVKTSVFPVGMTMTQSRRAHYCSSQEMARRAFEDTAEEAAAEAAGGVGEDGGRGGAANGTASGPHAKEAQQQEQQRSREKQRVASPPSCALPRWAPQ